MTVKAALINTITGYVDNVIMVNDLADVIPENHKLVEVDMIEDFAGKSDEEIALYNIIKDLDPDYKYFDVERAIHIGQTKWSEAQGFYEE